MIAALLATAVLTLVNHERVEHHVRPLRIDARLTLAARRCYDADLLRCVNHAGYTTMAVGRDLAHGQLSPRAAVLAWMHSPLHREILLDPRYHRTGIFVLPHRHRWIEVFAR